MFRRLRSDLDTILERDPAARSRMEVFLCYPGLHALWGHRLAHALWTHRLRLPARLLSYFVRMVTGIEIHPGARLGPGLFIDHGMGVVIGETAEIGPGVTLYHGVTLGGVSLAKGKRHPTLEDGVVVGAGAKVLGAITIGAHSRIGANAVVVKPVPPNSVVVGIPGEIVPRTGPAPHNDLAHDQLPDMVHEALEALRRRVDALERGQGGEARQEAPPSPIAMSRSTSSMP